MKVTSLSEWLMASTRLLPLAVLPLGGEVVPLVTGEVVDIDPRVVPFGTILTLRRWKHIIKTRNWGLIERQSSQLTIEGKGNRDYLFTLKKGSQRLIWPLYRDKTHLLRLKCVKTFKLTLIRWVVGSVLVRVELEFSDVVNRLGGMDLGSGMVGFGFLGRILRRR